MTLNLNSPGWENPFKATLIDLTETSLYIRTKEYLTVGMKVILGNHERELCFQISAVHQPMSQNYSYTLSPLENIDTKLVRKI